LRARCEFLLGRVTDDPARIFRAARIAENFLPAVKAAGLAAAKVDGPAIAADFLARAVTEDPFDNVLADELETALVAVGDAVGLERLRQDRQFLATALAIDPPPLVPATPQRERISLTMIVKDEAANLPACLDSVRDLVDELVVVDTGSTDRTAELAAARGARVIHIPWRDDFAAARNVGLDAARGDWIFWLDADERLGPSDWNKAHQLFKGLKAENAAYLMRQLSPSEEPGGATTAVDQVRLFRNRRDVRWEYRIHEQILLSVRRTRATVRSTDIVIAHSGYKDAELRDRKLTRNTRLLELAHREQPTDPILAFNLAWVYHKAGRAGDALPLLEHCRAVLSPRVSIVPKVYRLLGQTLDRLGRTSDAQIAFTTGRKLYPEDIELLLHHGLFLQRKKDYSGAETCFRRILALPPGTYPVGLDLGLLGYKTRNALAELFLEQGRLAEAKEQWLMALAKEPGFVPGRVGLATIALAQGQREEAAGLLDGLGPLDPIFRSQVARLRRLLATEAVVRVASELDIPTGRPSEWSNGTGGSTPVRSRRIVWEGGVYSFHSYARVNRAVCAQLIAHGHDVSVRPVDRASEGSIEEIPQALAGRVGSPLSGMAEVWVRHRWPPDFSTPLEGRFVLIQPWEYGSLPQSWVAAANRAVEVWAYSEAVRDCYISSGVPQEKVHVIPLGVDPTQFHPNAIPLSLPTRKQFRFLFVGGTIRRKGFDLLLAAYARAFTATDDVCLVVKDLGTGTFYAGQTGEKQVAAFRDRPGTPEIVYLTDPLPADQMPRLYAACDCLVLPFRGEGFGLPIAEAMACGRPVITTDASPATDYCAPTTGYLIQARRKEFPTNRVGNLGTVNRPWLHEPDLDKLAETLRIVADDPTSAKVKGRAASDHIRSAWTWDHTARAVELRLNQLLD
jgi:glycosyltransferase involved in cell wall biosynthesis